jgi:hypothetical protein
MAADQVGKKLRVWSPARHPATLARLLYG